MSVETSPVDTQGEQDRRRRRVADLVRQARIRRYRGREKAAAAAKVSPVTLRKIERGQPGVQEISYQAIEALLGWEEGSILRYIERGAPEPGPAVRLHEVRSAGSERITYVSAYAELTAEQQAQVDTLIARLREGN
jgi:transcriptional regulator with XRE-family HTH domain